MQILGGPTKRKHHKHRYKHSYAHTNSWHSGVSDALSLSSCCGRYSKTQTAVNLTQAKGQVFRFLKRCEQSRLCSALVGSY